MVRVIGAPAGAVYNAFVDPKRLQKWFAPHGHEVVEASGDARVGGRHRTVVDGPDGRYTMVGEYRELDPPKRIVMTWSTDHPPLTPSLAVGTESVITINLRKLAVDLTELTLEHELSVAGSTPADLKEGWNECLDNLAVSVVAEVSQAFREAVIDSVGSPAPLPNAVRDLITRHFHGRDPESYEVVTASYPSYVRLGFQRALDEFLAEDGRTYEVFGVHAPSAGKGLVSGSLAGIAVPLAVLLVEPSLAWSPPVISPPFYTVLPSGSDSTMSCLLQGLVLFEDSDGPAVMWIRNHVDVDFLSPSPERAAEVLAHLRERAAALSPYRGQIIEVHRPYIERPEGITILPRPDRVDADEVVLPAGLLEQIHEHTLNVVAARKVLEATGRHMKRGLLLHGRPGTGKTHTIRYLVSQMPEATVVVMSGERMVRDADSWFSPLDRIREVIDVIKPAVVVLDDVDFIAEDRSLVGMSGSRDALFALLDLLDGVDEDADILFILTTNRPNLLEPAVAARPGRIDQAIEVPLPDSGCRRRLLALYSRDLDLEASEPEVATFLERTEGVTASFVREAVRRAAVVAAALEGSPRPERLLVTGAQLLAALDQMLDPDNPLTSVLLGAEPEYAMPVLRQITVDDDS